MLRGGRPKDTIWQHFTRVEVAGKALVRCNYCAHQQSIKACKMQSRYSNCAAFSNEVGMSNIIYEYDLIFFIIK